MLLHVGSKSGPQATLPGDNPVYLETDLQSDKLPAAAITTIEDYLSLDLQNPLYETAPPAPTHLTTNGLNPYGDFGDSTLQRVASNINVAAFDHPQPEPLFDETEYEFVVALPRGAPSPGLPQNFNH